MFTYENNKKLSHIPLLFHNNSKAELFNNVFTKCCTLSDNASKIPVALNMKPTKTLSSFQVTRADIVKIIKNVYPNKTYWHDMISIWMLKLRGDSVLPHLELIFKSCLESGMFPWEWKKAIIVQMYKKGDKWSLKNYCTILLPISQKKVE